MVTEDELEERAVSPRVTLQNVKDAVLYEHFFTAAQGVRANSPHLNSAFVGQMESLERLTFCVLTLKNGFTVVGQSACASPENYQQDIGERIARDNAIKKIWELKGYELCSKQAGSWGR